MFFRAALLIGAVVWATSSSAEQRFAALTPPPPLNTHTENAYVATLQPVRAPIGWMQFCHEHPKECGSNDASEVVQLTSYRLAELSRVNSRINAEITPVTDAEHYGVTEKWSYPDDNKGDCEDYVLLKRRELIALGWPASTLLVTVVRDLKNEGHAVLTVHTSKGDLVLDNVHDKVQLWNETGYRFVKRQSREGANSWVSLTNQMGPEISVAARQ